MRGHCMSVEESALDRSSVCECRAHGERSHRATVHGGVAGCEWTQSAVRLQEAPISREPHRCADVSVVSFPSSAIFAFPLTPRCPVADWRWSVAWCAACGRSALRQSASRVDERSGRAIVVHSIALQCRRRPPAEYVAATTRRERGGQAERAAMRRPTGDATAAVSQCSSVGSLRHSVDCTAMEWFATHAWIAPAKPTQLEVSDSVGMAMVQRGAFGQRSAAAHCASPWVWRAQASTKQSEREEVQRRERLYEEKEDRGEELA